MRFGVSLHTVSMPRKLHMTRLIFEFHNLSISPRDALCNLISKLSEGMYRGLPISNLFFIGYKNNFIFLFSRVYYIFSGGPQKNFELSHSLILVVLVLANSNIITRIYICISLCSEYLKKYVEFNFHFEAFSNFFNFPNCIGWKIFQIEICREIKINYINLYLLQE